MLALTMILGAMVLAQQAPIPPAEGGPTDGAELEQGVSLRMYDISRDLPIMPELVEGQTPNVSVLVQGLSLTNGPFVLGDYFLAEADTYLKVENPGTYDMRLESDDASKLEIDGRVVVLGTPTYPHDLKTGVYLTTGLHHVKITLWEGIGDASIKLSWKPRGTNSYAPVPEELLFTEADQVRVTSPGPKNVLLPEGVAGGELQLPGDGRPLQGVHPFLKLTDLRPEGFEPKVGGMVFIGDTLAICTWDPQGAVYLLDGVTGEDVDTSKIKIRRIAEGLAEPLGLCYLDGRLFALQKQELTELIDTDDDGIIDFYRSAVADWNTSANFHEFAFGLAGRMTDDGPRLYAALAVAINPGGRTTVPQIPGRGVVVELNPDGPNGVGTSTVIGEGVRTPNGVGFGVDGELFVLDNQGDWLPASKMNHVPLDGKPHFFQNHTQPDHPWGNLPADPPAVWFPQGEIGNSPSVPVLIPDGPQWGPYAGQMLNGDVTHGGVKRVVLEKVNGEYQGAVFRFTQGVEAGVNRLVVGPDGDLYVGMIGSTGNWGHQGGLYFGLQKLSPGMDVPFEPLTMSATQTGFVVTFTRPAAEAYGADHFEMQHYRYEPTSEYGGDRIDRKPLAVTEVKWNDDRTEATLTTPDFAPGRVVHLRLRNMLSAEDEHLWSTEAWYTLNQIPGQPAPKKESHVPELTEKEKADGWQLLFTGRNFAGWHGYNKQGLIDGWVVTADGELHLLHPGYGDIVTDEMFGDFELSMDWKISEGGNSGIFYRGRETPGAPVWHTAMEMQVLDDQRHADAKNGRDRYAGALYALYPMIDPSPIKPAGEWNHVVIRLKDNHLTHEVNGKVVLETDLIGDDFAKRVAGSKFADLPDFAKLDRGVIGLQDHGDPVWYRNVKIRSLD